MLHTAMSSEQLLVLVSSKSYAFHILPGFIGDECTENARMILLVHEIVDLLFFTKDFMFVFALYGIASLSQ